MIWFWNRTGARDERGIDKGSLCTEKRPHGNDDRGACHLHPNVLN